MAPVRQFLLILLLKRKKRAVVYLIHIFNEADDSDTMDWCK